MSSFVVRLRGLPWTCKKADIAYFLRECHIAGGDEGIHFTFSREGRPSGEAFVELDSEDDVTHALAQNNEHIGNRYIEVFTVERSEMDWMVKRAGAGSSNKLGLEDAVVKLRGLPFVCSKEEISQFFTGLQIVPNGILLPEDRQGRSTGEAFVQFASPDIAAKALEKHRERIGHRYIEIFKSSMKEATGGGCMRGNIRPLMGGGMAMGMRPGPYDRGDRMGMGMMGMGRGGRGRNVKGFFDEEFDDCFGGGMDFGMMSRRGGMAAAMAGAMVNAMRGGALGRGMGMMDGKGVKNGSGYMSKTGHSVHMRGLPFQAVEQDVFDFFSPIQPVRCQFEFNENGRSTGEANVDFATHQEALAAMKKHKSNMQHRYIELFLNSEPNFRNNFGSDGFGNDFGGGNMGSGQGFSDDFGGLGFGSGRMGFGFGGSGRMGQQGHFGNMGAAGSFGFGNQGLSMGSGYDMGGGFGDGMGSGRMMGNNYSF